MLKDYSCTDLADPWMLLGPCYNFQHNIDAVEDGQERIESNMTIMSHQCMNYFLTKAQMTYFSTDNGIAPHPTTVLMLYTPSCSFP